MKSQINNPNWLQEMPRKKLKEYIFSLLRLVEIDTENKIFKHWLIEAQKELFRRDEIIKYYSNKKTTNN